jgi:hypothetical protein
MSNYQNQKNVNTTVFRAKSAKVAMGDARIAFGNDVEILSVEKVGGVYCVEVSNPLRGYSLVADDPTESPLFIPQKARNLSREIERVERVERVVDSSLDFESMNSIERLERKFEELAARVVSQNHQGGALAELGSIRKILGGLGFGEPFLGEWRYGDFICVEFFVGFGVVIRPFCIFPIVYEYPDRSH